VKVGVQTAAFVAQQANLPFVGSAASLILQLIDVCDKYQCNKEAFLALKSRLLNWHRLYFGKGGKLERISLE